MPSKNETPSSAFLELLVTNSKIKLLYKTFIHFKNLKTWLLIFFILRLALAM